MNFKSGRALIIGIANYEQAPPLPEAVLYDAHDTADVLKSPAYCGYPEENVTVLTDSAATLAGIRQALVDIASIASSDDTVAIFFSGHGTRLDRSANANSALVPYDCKLSDLSNTTITEAEFSLAIARIKARRVVVIIDACHAGGTASLKEISSGDFDAGFDDKSLQQLATGTGRVVFASSRSTEKSLIQPGKRNSVFTTAILSGLRGAAPTSGDGTIKVFDLFNYVSEIVRQTVPGRQHPIFKASQLEENFPIALAAGGAKSVISDGNDAKMRDLEQVLVDLFPAGPGDQDIWLRAGGDLSLVKLGGTGRSQWFSALRTLSQGGGGKGISRSSLIRAALEDFPNHRELKTIEVHDLRK